MDPGILVLSKTSQGCQDLLLGWRELDRHVRIVLQTAPVWRDKDFEGGDGMSTLAWVALIWFGGAVLFYWLFVFPSWYKFYKEHKAAYDDPNRLDLLTKDRKWWKKTIRKGVRGVLSWARNRRRQRNSKNK